MPAGRIAASRNLDQRASTVSVSPATVNLVKEAAHLVRYACRPHEQLPTQLHGFQLGLHRIVDRGHCLFEIFSPVRHQDAESLGHTTRIKH